MASHIDILRRASSYEGQGKDGRPRRTWSAYQMGATQADINSLLADELLEKMASSSRIGQYDYAPARYRLTDKGRSIVFAASMEKEFRKIPVEETLEAMQHIIGFDDLKLEIARALEKRKRTHFLLEGPPACSKSVLMETVRTVAPDAYMAFGSRTSAAGLSGMLFEHQPGILLMDEADKMRHDVFSVLLGLMERGEIIETKIQKTRGILLETMVIAACNSSAKMPREFLSRFALHVHFPEYTRDEFVDVCHGMLTYAQCPPEIAILIGELIFDLSPLKGGTRVWDLRKARAAWDVMNEPTKEEVKRIVSLMRKYGPREIVNGHHDVNAAQRRMI